MSDTTRLAALEAVAEAARDMEERGFGTPALVRALCALDALPAPATATVPVGEVVTLAVWRSINGVVGWSIPDMPDAMDQRWHRLGTVTLPLDIVR